MTVMLDRPGAADLDIEDVVRRRELIVGAAALAGLISAGCGGSDRSARDDAAPGSSRAQRADAPSGLPGQVVALDPFLTLPTLTRLGVEVIAVLANGSFPAWLPADVTAGVVDLGGYATANLEHLVALAPDTLVGLNGTVDALPAEISEIAPLSTIPSTGANGGWRDGMRALAELAGRPDAVNDVIAALDERVRPSPIRSLRAQWAPRTSSACAQTRSDSTAPTTSEARSWPTVV